MKKRGNRVRPHRPAHGPTAWPSRIAGTADAAGDALGMSPMIKGLRRNGLCPRAADQFHERGDDDRPNSEIGYGKPQDEQSLAGPDEEGRRPAAWSLFPVFRRNRTHVAPQEQTQPIKC